MYILWRQYLLNDWNKKLPGKGENKARNMLQAGKKNSICKWTNIFVACLCCFCLDSFHKGHFIWFRMRSLKIQNYGCSSCIDSQWIIYLRRACRWSAISSMSWLWTVLQLEVTSPNMGRLTRVSENLSCLSLLRVLVLSS